jgi:threonine dehydratase
LAIRTFLWWKSATFSRLCGREIFLKIENPQKTGSFKIRGASTKIQLLDPKARARGLRRSRAKRARAEGP